MFFSHMKFNSSSASLCQFRQQKINYVFCAGNQDLLSKPEVISRFLSFPSFSAFCPDCCSTIRTNVYNSEMIKIALKYLHPMFVKLNVWREKRQKLFFKLTTKFGAGGIIQNNMVCKKHWHYSSRCEQNLVFLALGKLCFGFVKVLCPRLPWQPVTAATGWHDHHSRIKWWMCSKEGKAGLKQLINTMVNIHMCTVEHH